MRSNLTKAEKDALYAAAIGLEMKAGREADGRPLVGFELAGFNADQAAARLLGFTDADIRAYQRSLPAA
jgi:erythromycin esterase-like protein